MKLFLPQYLFNKLDKRLPNKLYVEWQNNGCPTPPPHKVKQLAIGDFQSKHNCNILVETGTYMGDMVEAQKNNFKMIYSIELGVELYKKATKRFKNDNNVMIVQGDSGMVFSKVLRNQ